MENSNSFYAISPVDGRYSDKTQEFRTIFSEFGLMKARLIAEVEYLIELIAFLGPTRVRQFKEIKLMNLRHLYQKFSASDFRKIKAIEKITTHDVKAVEYFLRNKLPSLGLKYYVRYVHLGRTSEDINNTAEALMLKYGAAILLKHYIDVLNKIMEIADEGKNVPMLPFTHGQPASPSTIGWTMYVYRTRLEKLILKLKEFQLQVKFGGATGGDNAMNLTYPDLDWRKFCRKMVNVLSEVKFENNIEASMGYTPNTFTFQIEPHDTYKELFEIITGLNSILIDFSQNMWMYISQEYFLQKPKEGEIGSTAMPHKINPINFENAEGNFGIANALLEFFSRKLPISRGYRDLTDSTVERKFGDAFAHTIIALKALKKGLGSIYINKPGLEEKLEQHWEAISEGYQVVLRDAGVEEGYELLMKKVKGQKVTREMLHNMVDILSDNYNLQEDVVLKLKSITPHNYIGNREF